MIEVLNNLLIALIALLLSVATTAITVFLKSKTAQIKNQTVRQLLIEVDEALSTAVTATSQTYVDQLKKEKNFGKDAQVEALNKAKDTFNSLISADAEKLLNTMYSTEESLDAFITAKIEEKVKVQKESFITLSSQ